MRILIVQYAGDYRAAYDRMQADGGETYYGHRYVLEQLVRLQALGEVAMMCCLSTGRYDTRLPNGITMIGANSHPRRQARKVTELMEAWNPTHVIVFGPLPSVVRWALRTDRRVACVMADSFEVHALKRLLRYGRLVPLLNNGRVELVANHGVNACRSLVRIGVDPEKVVAWDYPYSRHPLDLPARTLSNSHTRTMLYVGAIHPMKGVGDAIRATAILNRRGVPLRLRLAGDGQTDRFIGLATQLGIDDQVQFMGSIPNSEVFDLMRAADIVVVPSRRQYPEGLPLTIYEAVCARTPIVASNHPMFRGHLVDEETATVFDGGDPQALADKVANLLGDPGLYAEISENSKVAWERMQNPVKWGDLLFHWLGDTPPDHRWLGEARRWTRERGQF